MQKLDLVKETDSSKSGAVKEHNIVLQLSPDLIEFVVEETVWNVRMFHAFVSNDSPIV